MHRLAEIRDQENICRARAQCDHARRAFWSARAEQWQQIACDEIAFAFRESQSSPATSGS
jgi:hypothetical protein